MDNMIVFWMCFACGWAVITFASLGITWWLMRELYRAFRNNEQIVKWKEKADKWDKHSRTCHSCGWVLGKGAISANCCESPFYHKGDDK